MPGATLPGAEFAKSDEGRHSLPGLAGLSPDQLQSDEDANRRTERHDEDGDGKTPDIEAHTDAVAKTSRTALPSDPAFKPCRSANKRRPPRKPSRPKTGVL